MPSSVIHPVIMNPRTLLAAIVVSVSSLLLMQHADAKKLNTIPKPDFTKGDDIPEGSPKDWNLGATGCRGWMYWERMETTPARQILITKVAKGSPAHGILEKGDVVVGIGKKPFEMDARVAFGKALTLAESEAGAGKLELLLWRGGKTETVTVQLPVLGTYSATAPYDCAKSTKIFELGCEALAKRISSPGYKESPISRSLNALALLASGNDKYLPVLQSEAAWAANYSAESFSTWYYGYVISYLAEYAMVTGDRSVIPGLRRLSLEAARGQSIVGSWGHKFAGDDGRLVGYGMMNAPGVPLTISLVLAQQAGIQEKELEVAIERSAKLLRFYIGKGAVPYGDHHPWIRSHEDNGKCGMAAVLFNLLKEPEGSKFFSRMSLASHGLERDAGHTGNFWNMAWAMPGVNQSGPQATGAWMKEFGTYYYDIARTHEGLFPHPGPPQATPDATAKWDASGAYLLAYAMPLKKLILTGRKPSTSKQLSAEEARSIISDGRGYSRIGSKSIYEDVAAETLIERLGSWSPVVRERAAEALARHGKMPLEPIIALLDSKDLNTRLGACQALAQFEKSAAPAVPKLRETLKAEDMWLRIKAADALAAIGEAAKPAATDLLKMLICEPGPDDPRAMEQRYLCFALFNRGGLLNKDLNGVDRALAIKAMSVGLTNEDGRARGAISGMYAKLTGEEIASLMPNINRSVMEPSLSGIMFSDGSRMEGLKLLAQKRMEEGIDASMYWLKTQNHWGSQKRTPILLDILLDYGVHAKGCIAELENLAADYEAGIPIYFPKKLSLEKAKCVRDAIVKLKATSEKPILQRID